MIAPSIQVERYTLSETGQFARRDVDYAEHPERFEDFTAGAPTLEAFGQAIERRRAAAPVDRALLVEVLSAQYAQYGCKPPAGLHDLAQAETFCVTTAHQASLVLGPLYYVYKILSTVSLARQLTERYPDYRFVPVFVLGAEDHDLDEIDHLYLGQERVHWPTQQTGSTGRMRLHGIDAVLDQIAEQIGTTRPAREILTRLRATYSNERTLGLATADFVAQLFAPYGVVVANLSDARLKRSFAPYLRRELTERLSQPLVDQQVNRLAELGYGQQAHARDINLFYLSEGRRDRIVFDELANEYEVLDLGKRFGEQELLTELETYPERFSPNVVMRPVLQEFCLPNLAYVGGGGELAYWLERRAQFEAFELPFPILVRRDSAWWITAEAQKLLLKLDLEPIDLLGDRHVLEAHLAKAASSHDTEVERELAQIDEVFSSLAQRAAAVDQSLERKVLADGHRAHAAVKDVHKRMIRRLKRHHADQLQRLEQLLQLTAPGGKLQERRESFLTLYARHGKELFDLLLADFNPLDARLKVFVEEVWQPESDSFS